MLGEGRRAALFGAIVVAAVVVSAVAISSAVGRSTAARAAAGAVPAEPVPDGPTLAFLTTSDGVYRRLGWAPVDSPGAPGYVSSLVCERVYFAAGRGLCAGTGGGSSGLVLFDRELRLVKELTSEGIASRVRISRDGRYGATTFFVNGDSYADAGFSTRTTIYSMATGDVIGNLEDFATYREGQRVRSIDFNFWGVTFAADSDRFYATLGTAGETYLVDGAISARTIRVLRSNVECPSLSPDGTQLVFKKRMPSASPLIVTWRLYSLDLGTMAERALADTRSVDDQVEWLDANRIVYFVSDAGPPATIRPDLWSLDLRGGAPTLLRTGATSAVVIH